jgi:hypothetical protein
MSGVRNTRRRLPMAVLLLTVAGLLSGFSRAGAQSPSDGQTTFETAGPLGSGTLYSDAPPEPIAPEVITRDAEGRATVRAVRLSQPLRIDGAVDEALYRDVPSM